MKRSRSISAFAALAALGLLSACAAPTDVGSTGSITITFSSYTYGTQGAAAEGTQALLDAFAAQHPDVTVVPQAVPTADVLTKAKADVVAGDAPDVVQLGYSKMAEAFHTLPVQSIEQIAGDDWASHVEGINAALVQTGERDGSIAALPFTNSVPTVFYNADLFRAAGLDPDEPPTSIDEVREAAEAIVSTGHNGVYFGIADPSKSDYVTQSVINSAGGAIVSDSGEVTVDSAEAIEGLSAVQALTTDGLQPAVGLEDALANFSSGDLGMLVASTAVAGNLQTAAEGAFELRTTGFPSFSDGPARPTFSGAGLIVLSSDSAEQQAAWEFVKFLTSAEGYSIVTEQIGYLPLRADLVDDPDYLQGYFEENQLLVPPLEQLADVAPYLAFPGEDANQAVVLLQDDAVEPIVLRGADPKDTLTQVGDRIRELTAQ
ncbi:ABC transporter substrate-binding protein [Nocardia jinanensis]|uniref:ABC transporter substrate-binding protein n=1 Tax=Nocardia jinanensis TaxID=382504 RepID=A0A917W016_9NOCA|nr:ABC transporter substrate-binding protein [Nocardia jinanensis]GGL45931.1 ABC transporter substrate-binding protein [Nocardia jinanensis]